MQNIALVQVIDGFENLSVNFPPEFLSFFGGRILLQVTFQGLTLAVLHLDVQNFDAFVVLVALLLVDFTLCFELR